MTVDSTEPLQPAPPSLVDHLEDVRLQLSAFSDQLRTANPSVYRDLALYLQVLREGLLNSVQQASFHLATHFFPDRYCDLLPAQRTALHGRIAERVQRCCSLLTVEQVVQLAGQIGREHRQRLRQRQQEWLAQLRKVGEEVSPTADDEPDSPAGGGPDPAGSIRLNAALPFNLERWQALSGLSASQNSHQDDSATRESPYPGGATDGSEADGDSGDPWEGLLDSQAESLLDSLFESAGMDAPPSPWDSGCLPTDPQALMVWLEGFEHALVRRLRNLSHSVNVELLHAGLSRALLPVSLLQAALQGQLEPQPAPANLLRLQLPTGADGSHDMDTVVLLLRLSDLELDQPRLRSCRGRWQRHRQEIRRMAAQHRRLQRQLQRLEAQRLWHQDLPSQSQPPRPPQAPPQPG